MGDSFDLADDVAKAFEPALDEPELDYYGLIALNAPMTFLNLWHGPKVLMPKGASIGEPLLLDSYLVTGGVDHDTLEPLPDVEYVTSARVVAPCGVDADEKAFGPDVKCKRARGHGHAHRSTRDDGSVLSWL
jgi:hypothetical protein